MLSRVKDRLLGKTDTLKTKRSSQWPKVRKAWIKANAVCAACGGTAKLEVHHIQPFHLNPELELDMNNLITLCESWKHGVCCHIFVGHLGSYRKINTSVRDDAQWLLARLAKAPKEDPIFETDIEPEKTEEKS